MLVAGVWGYVGVMLRDWSGLPPGNPGVGLLTAALGALFLYGPAIVAAVWSNGRVPRKGFSTLRGLYTFAICLIVSLLFLVSLNVAQAVMVGAVAGGAFHRVVYAALLFEAPMAGLGAVQGVFVLAYLDLYRGSRDLETARKWRLIGLNVATLLLLAVVATHLNVAVIETVGRWGNPAFVRPLAWSDFISRVPAAGLIALIIGLVMSSALSSRFADHGRRFDELGAAA